MEHFQEIVGQLTPLVSKLSLSQTKPQPNVSKGTTELLAFWEKRRKQYLAKRRRSSSSNMKVSSPPNSLSEPIIDGVTDDDEAIAECIVKRAKQRQRSKKGRLLKKRTSIACIKRVSHVELLTKSSEKEERASFLPKMGWSHDQKGHSPASHSSKTGATQRSKHGVILTAETYKLGTPVKKEICQLYRSALEVGNSPVPVPVLGFQQLSTELVRASEEVQQTRIRTVFLSEQHSALCPETNIPKVPPVSPEPEAKRTLLYSDGKTTDKRVDTQSEIAVQINQLKQQQRTEIYALNKVMGKLEEDNFKSMKESKV
jgi:hypothetical protein